MSDQNIQVTTITYKDGTAITESSGIGAPPLVAVGLTRYTQLDTNPPTIWISVNGTMTQQNPVFGNVGPGHSSGLVPDPGPTISQTKFLTDHGWDANALSLPFTPENIANKDKPNGYAGLDQSGQVPADLLLNAPGTAGPSAYQVAVANGFTGNQTQWLTSLTGPPGASGIGLPIYATTSSGITPGTGASPNAFFFTPSTNIDGLYDTYQNVSNTAVFVSTVPKQDLVSTAAGLTLTDAQGFSVKLFDTATGTIPIVEPRLEELEAGIFKSAVGLSSAGTGLTSTATGLTLTDAQGFSAVILNPVNGDSPVFDATYGLQNQINLLNSACLAFSTSVRNRFNPTMQAFGFGHNYVTFYGQSLMCGYSCVGTYDTTQPLGNFCIGTHPQWQSSLGAALPQGDTLNHPCIELQNTATISGDTGVTRFGIDTKTLINLYRGNITNDLSKVFVSADVACPGEPIANLISSAAPDSSGSNLWNRVQRSAQYAQANASNANVSIGSVAFVYDQGEQDYGLSLANVSVWSNALIQMRADYDSLMTNTLGQVNQAGMYTYQTGGSFENNAADDISIGMAQWHLAKTQPNWFMFGPHYAYPDTGGHKTGNSYRWMMAMCAKVWFRTAVLRQGWLPLGPHKCVIAGNTLLVGFHVPAPPLTVQTAYNIATPVNFSDLGFNLFDAKGWIPFTSVSIVADTVVQFVPSRIVDWSTAQLKYADIGNGSQNATTMKGTPHGARGNLTDSDTAVSQTIYVHPDGDASQLPVTTPPQPAAGYDIVGLSGLPYKLNNWCVAFNIFPATFTG